MPGVVRRFLHPFLFPAGLALAGAAAVIASGVAAGWPQPVLDGLPYAVAAGGFLAGWRFNRSRVAFAALLVAGAWLAMSRAPAGPTGAYVRHAVALLLPLELAALSLGRERGVLSLRGLARFAGVALPVAVAAFIGVAHRDAALAVLGARWLPLADSAPYGLSHVTIVAAAASLLCLLVRALRRQGALDAGLFWAAAAGVGATLPLAPGGRALLASAAALALVAGLVETSHALAFQDELTGLPTRRALREGRTVARAGGALGERPAEDQPHPLAGAPPAREPSDHPGPPLPHAMPSVPRIGRVPGALTGARRPPSIAPAVLSEGSP